jgi:hypothetical protein
MTVGELLEELEGADPNMEVLIATERPNGSWSVNEVTIVDDEDNTAAVFLHCEVPR